MRDNQLEECRGRADVLSQKFNVNINTFSSASEDLVPTHFLLEYSTPLLTQYGT